MLLRTPPSRGEISLNVFLLLVFGLILLDAGVILPWFVGGIGMAILGFGPIDNSRIGTWIREDSLLGFVLLMAILLVLIVGPLIVLDASSTELWNYVTGIILGGFLLIIATLLYTR